MSWLPQLCTMTQIVVNSMKYDFTWESSRPGTISRWCDFHESRINTQTYRNIQLAQGKLIGRYVPLPTGLIRNRDDREWKIPVKSSVTRFALSVARLFPAVNPFFFLVLSFSICINPLLFIRKSRFKRKFHKFQRRINLLIREHELPGLTRIHNLL